MSFEIESGVLNKYTGTDTEVIIPDGVVIIEGYAFRDCADLTSATISDGVKEIKYYAFVNCRKLEKTTIPKSVKTLSFLTFCGCMHLHNIKFKELSK